jgi:phospholipid/cholesterol/gamma-HCH transport system permease protein
MVYIEKRGLIDLEGILNRGRFAAVDTVGRWVNGKLHYYLDLSTLLYLTFKELIAEREKGFPMVWEITLRQIYFTGVEALKVITLVSLALGTVLIVESASQMRLLGGTQFISTILVVVVIRELGPLLTAFIVIGRSGTAIAAELGNMIVAHELEAIRVMGINPIYFIVAPRIIGVTVAVICLTIYFNAVALVGGFVFSELILPTDLPIFLNELIISLTLTDVVFGILKSAVFGLLTGLTCTYHGLTVRYSSTEVPQVATRGVVSAILAIIIFNVSLTLLFYL